MMSMTEFRNRPLEVKVFTYCDHCSTLKEGVEAREHRSYWPTIAINMKSCAPCFEKAKREASAEYNVTIC